MDSRGYARARSGGSDRRVAVLLLLALLAAAVGSYGLLDGTSPAWLGLPVLAVGLGAAIVGSTLAGRAVRHTRYRPDPWGLPETVVAGSGLLAALVLVAVTATDPAAVDPSLSPLGWPPFPPAAVLSVALAVAPAVVGRRPA